MKAQRVNTRRDKTNNLVAFNQKNLLLYINIYIYISIWKYFFENEFSFLLYLLRKKNKILKIGFYKKKQKNLWLNEEKKL